MNDSERWYDGLTPEARAGFLKALGVCMERILHLSRKKYSRLPKWAQDGVNKYHRSIMDVRTDLDSLTTLAENVKALIRAARFASAVLTRPAVDRLDAAKEGLDAALARFDK